MLTPPTGNPDAPAVEQPGVHDLGADLLAAVARLNRLASRLIQMPLPAAQARLLAVIEAQGEARIGDLAEFDHCSQPTMTTQVRRLEDAGLVTRSAHPEDGRAVRIRISNAGVLALAEVRAGLAAAIEPHLDQLSTAERHTLAAAIPVLHRLLDNATTWGRGSTT